MAKRFAYVSFGILCLVASYQLGVERAKADWDHSGTGAIVGGDFRTYFGAAGDAWRINHSTASWDRTEEFDLPFPASEVKFYSQASWDGGVLFLVTKDDEAWFKLPSPQYAWEYVGLLPGTPVSLQSQSLGGTKSKYR